MKLVRIALPLVSAVFAAAPALGQDTFPSRPIQIVVGFSPGGSADILARLIAERLGSSLKQQVIVENKPGAGGSIAASAVAKAPADGYTLFLASTSHTINASYYPKLPYDTVKGFSAVAPIAVVPYVMVASPNLATRTLKGVVDLAKASPGKLNYGSSGNGTATHLAGEMFKSTAGVEIMHIPYKGPAEQIQEVLAGRVEMTLVPVNAAKSFIDGGKLTALGVTTAKRSSIVEAPTFAEAGIKGYEFTPWFGLLAPAGTPRAVVDKLNAQVAAAVADPDLKAKLLAQGAEPMSMKPDAFDALVKSEVARFATIFRDANIQRQ